jgi:hypothetical protein
MILRKQADADERKAVNGSENKRQIQAALGWLLNHRSIEDLPVHGNTNWKPKDLVMQALLWTWSESKTLTGAFDDARAQSHKLIGQAALSTYQGLAMALETRTPCLMPILNRQAHRLMEHVAGSCWRVGRFVPLAVDGSRATCPRTLSNESAFCAKNYGQGQTAKYRKKKTKGLRRRKNQKAKPQPPAPQMWVTLMWHIGVGLPWCWKLGPSNASERDHVKDMLDSEEFAENTLFVGDAGFVGYALWKKFLRNGHHFLVRVGANVKLLKNLGYRYKKGKKGLVSCWPKDAMNQNLPPLVLRLIRCRIGNKRVCLLTSVLDEHELTKAEAVELYKRRWGIELEFRGLKQTFERRVLRSKKSARALTEMHWSIYGMLVLELFALKAQAEEEEPRFEELSFAKALQAIRMALKNLSDRPAYLADLWTDLNNARVDDYERHSSKAARYKSTKKDKPSCGLPKLIPASREQKQKYKKRAPEIPA